MVHLIFVSLSVDYAVGQLEDTVFVVRRGERNYTSVPQSVITWRNYSRPLQWQTASSETSFPKMCKRATYGEKILFTLTLSIFGSNAKRAITGSNGDGVRKVFWLLPSSTFTSPTNAQKLKVVTSCCTQSCTERGGGSFARFWRWGFEEFPRLVGCYCSYLLPKQARGTPQILIFKT